MSVAAPADGVLVTVRNVHKEFRRGGERIDVLQGLSLDIPRGDFLALMGPSGSGKSTLLNLLGGLDRPTRGEVEIGGQRIDQMSGGQLAAWRARHIGFVFQMYNLLPVLTAERNVELPLLLTSLGAREAPAARRHGAGRGRPHRSREALPAAALGRPGAARRASRAPWSPTRRCCCATSRRAISTARRATRFSTCCRA